MSGTRGIILALLIGLVLGAVVHIVIILALPWAADGAAFARLVPNTGETIELDSDTQADPARIDLSAAADPAVASSVCAFDLSSGPVRVVVPVGGLVQSVSVHARRGGVIYALSDRAAVRGNLSIVLLTPEQFEAALAEDGADGTQELRVPIPVSSGYVVTRVVAPLPSLMNHARRLALGARCLRP